MNFRIRKSAIVFALMIFLSFFSACSSGQSISVSDHSEATEKSVLTSSEDTINENDEVSVQQKTGSESDEVSAITQVTSQEIEKVPGENLPQTSPTPDTRLLPEDWKNWDVVPQISPNAIEIYNKGLASGNNPAAFSKIGDCQAISQVLLGIYDHPDRYQLSNEQQHLQSTIDYYQGSFDRDGMAVKGGFNAAAVLSPMWADPDVCKAGETPIECEYRVHKPSMVIISLEVWWEGRTVERYEEYMRRIIDYSIEQGVLPILSTKADNVEKDHSINLATAKLAYEYDIPLWNFWRAVQTLPYKGIDPARDGFHITTEAWNVRSFTALQTIDAVYQAANNTEVTATVQGKAAEEVEETEETTTDEQPAIDPININVSDENEELKNYQGQVLFDITSRQIQNIENEGIYLLDFQQGTLKKVVEAGYSLQSISPDDHFMLVNKENELYLASIDKPDLLELLTDRFYYYGKIDAVWDMAQNNIYAILHSEDGNSVWRFSLDGDENIKEKITDGSSAPVEFIPSMTIDHIYWKNGTCSGKDECNYQDIQAVQIADNSFKIESYPELSQPVFAHHSEYIADREQTVEGKADIMVSTQDHSIEKVIQLPADHLVDYSWSFSDEKLLVLKLVRSDYSGKASKIRVFAIQPETWLTEEYPSANGITFQDDWSPDGEQFILTGINQSEDGIYHMEFNFYHAALKSVKSLNKTVTINSEDYFSVNQLYWLNLQ